MLAYRHPRCETEPCRDAAVTPPVRRADLDGRALIVVNRGAHQCRGRTPEPSARSSRRHLISFSSTPAAASLVLSLSGLRQRAQLVRRGPQHDLIGDHRALARVGIRRIRGAVNLHLEGGFTIAQ